MAEFVIAAVSLLGAEIGSAALIIYAVEIAYAAILIGGLAYASSQQRRAQDEARDAYNAARVDRLQNISSSTAPREMVMGRVRKAGTIFFRGSSGAQSRDLYVAVALAGHEIDGVEQYWLNDQLVTLNASGFVQEAPYSSAEIFSASTTIGGPYLGTLVPGSVRQYYASYDESGAPVGAPAGENYQYSVLRSAVKITVHRGEPGQTVDAALLAGFPALWSTANVMQGLAYAVCKFTYSETAFPTGVPALTVTMRGAKLFDPRTGLTTYSANPALMIRHLYTHGNFGKSAITATEDLRIIAAANACDQVVTWQTVDFGGILGIGVVNINLPLYSAAIVFPFGAAPKNCFDDLVQAMAGSWAFAGGELYLKSGVYSAPVMSLTDADLAVVQRSGGGESQTPISISTHREKARKFNVVKVKIWDAAQNFKEVSLTELAAPALVTRDGEKLPLEISFPAIGYAPQALHVAGVLMRDARDPLVVDLPLKLRAYPLELFDTIDLTISRYGFVNKTFLIINRVWQSNGSLRLSLKETNAAIFQRDAAFAAQGHGSNTSLPRPWEIQMVGALSFSTGETELLRQQDGTIVSRMRISWPQITDAAVLDSGNVEVQFRPASSTGAWTSLIVAGNETQAVTADVQDRQAYVVRARSKTRLAISNWNTEVTVVVIGKTAPPPPFDIFLILAQSDGTRQYNFSYLPGGQPLDWLGAEIRFISGTVPVPIWDSMTPLQDSQTYYTNSPVELNQPVAGIYTFACRSIDTTGNLSTARVFTIDLPDRRLGNVFSEYFESATGWPGIKTGCHVQGGTLEANDSTTWATIPANAGAGTGGQVNISWIEVHSGAFVPPPTSTTWAQWARWNSNPASPIYYETSPKDFGTILAGQIDANIDVEGSIFQELATSTNGITWSAWGSISAAFSSRYIKIRITVTDTVAFPVPVIKVFDWRVTVDLKVEYVNDIVAASLTGGNRFGVGDIRVPFLNTSLSVIKDMTVTIQHASSGSWTWVRVDNSLPLGPRIRLYRDGVLADPDFIDAQRVGY